jgi:hypothetical protein
MTKLRDAILDDPVLSERHKKVLLDLAEQLIDPRPLRAASRPSRSSEDLLRWLEERHPELVPPCRELAEKLDAMLTAAMNGEFRVTEVMLAESNCSLFLSLSGVEGMGRRRERFPN